MNIGSLISNISLEAVFLGFFLYDLLIKRTFVEEQEFFVL